MGDREMTDGEVLMSLYESQRPEEEIFDERDMIEIRLRIRPEVIKMARETMRRAFETDEGFYHSYQANVSCVLMDELGGLGYTERMRVADAILRRIFWE